MSVTAKWYPSAAAQMFTGNVTSTNTFKVALLSSAGVYNTAHGVYADVSASELPAEGGYTSGGAPTTITVTSDANGSYFETSAVLWTAATFTFQNAVIYDDTSTGKRLLLHLAFALSQSPNNQEYQLNVPSPRNRATPA